MAPPRASSCWHIEGSYTSAKKALESVLASPSAAEKIASIGFISELSPDCPRRRAGDTSHEFEILCAVDIEDSEGSRLGYISVTASYDDSDIESIVAGGSVDGFVLAYVPYD